MDHGKRVMDRSMCLPLVIQHDMLNNTETIGASNYFTAMETKEKRERERRTVKIFLKESWLKATDATANGS